MWKWAAIGGEGVEVVTRPDAHSHADELANDHPGVGRFNHFMRERVVLEIALSRQSVR